MAWLIFCIIASAVWAWFDRDDDGQVRDEYYPYQNPGSMNPGGDRR